MEIEVGKKYEDQHGRVVEIVAHNDRPPGPHKAFIGLRDRGTGVKFVRYYGAKGEAFAPLVREHVPFKLEVGKAYAMRNNGGYGVVIHEDYDGAFYALLSKAGKTVARKYDVDGHLLHGGAAVGSQIDLVPGAIFAPGYAFGYQPVAAAAAARILVDLLTGEDRIGEVEEDHSSAVRTLRGARFEIRQAMGR